MWFCISESQRILFISFSRTDSGLCIKHLWTWSNFSPLYHFPVDHLSHLIMFTLQFLLSQFTAFSFCVINCFILLLLSFTLFQVFHTIISQWFLTGVWVTARFLKSPGFFSVTDLNNAVIWIVSTRPFISKSSSPLVTVPRAPITMGITVTFMFHSFFISLVRTRYLSLFSFSFNFTLGSAGIAKSTILFLVDYYKVWSQRNLCISFSRTDSRLCMYHLFVWLNFNFLYNSQWITLPTQSCLVLYSLWANLLHSLIMWLIILSLSPHNLHLLFRCILSILTLIWLVLMALFCAAIRRDSVSLLRFLFLSYVHIFSWDIAC